MNQITLRPKPEITEASIADAITASTDSARKRALKKFGLAAVGAIPWVGGFLVAAIELRENPHKFDELQRQWLEHHADKLRKLHHTLHATRCRATG